MWIESEQLRVECLVVSKVVRVLGIEHRSRIVGARGVNQDLPRHAHQRTSSRSMLICYCASKAPYISVLERKYLSQNHFFCNAIRARSSIQQYFNWYSKHSNASPVIINSPIFGSAGAPAGHLHALLRWLLIAERTARAG